MRRDSISSHAKRVPARRDEGSDGVRSRCPVSASDRRVGTRTAAQVRQVAEAATRISDERSAGRESEEGLTHVPRPGRPMRLAPVRPSEVRPQPKETAATSIQPAGAAGQTRDFGQQAHVGDHLHGQRTITTGYLHASSTSYFQRNYFR